MKQAEFEFQHSAFWDDFAQILEAIESRDKAKLLNARRKNELSSFPQNYRQLSQHLAIAKARRYSPSLRNQLNDLVRRAYLNLYGKKGGRRGILLDFVLFEFPLVLRANARFVWAATLIFCLPALVMGVACYFNEQLIFSLMDAGGVRGMESMYDPALGKIGRERQSDTDLMMFGFYIQNNIGVSFRCFGTGIFFGLGSLFFILFNGLLLGGIAGHLTALGYQETFYPFVIGHGAFELTAIVFSGAAGLKLGYALLSPGAVTRLEALKLAASEAIKIIYGCTIMLVIAAFLEAFWSSSSALPIAVKISVGVGFWVLVLYYCFYQGREHES